MEEEEIVKEVRALLLSAPHGLTSKELLRDFLNFVGAPFPYKQFGYSTLDAYLQSKPRIARRCFENGQTIYRAIADETTAHIAKMVSKQRTKKPKSRLVWGGNKTPMHSGHAGSGGFGTPYSSPSVSSPGLRSRPKDAIVDKVPYATRQRIRDLLQQYPDGVPSDQFLQLFRSVHRLELSPKRIGYNHLNELLQAIPDVVRMERSKSVIGFLVYPALVKAARHGGGQERSDSEHIRAALSASRQQGAVGEDLRKEIKQIVADRPNGLWAGRFPLEYEARFHRPFPFETLGFSSVVELLSTVPDACSLRRPFSTGDFLVSPSETGANSPSSQQGGSSGLRAASSNAVSDRQNGFRGGHESERQSGSAHQPPTRLMSPVHAKTHALSTSDRLIDGKTQSRLLRLVQCFMPLGLKCSMVGAAYERHYGERLDLQLLGFHSVESLLSIMDSSLYLEESDQDCFVKTMQSRRVLSPVSTTAEPSDLYQHATSPFASSPSRQPNANGSARVRKRSSVDQVNGNGLQQFVDWSTSHSSRSQHDRRPLGYAPITSLSSGSHCHVAITDVVSPQHFSVQIVSDQTTGELEALSKHMNLLYEGRHGNNSVLNSPEVGSNCAALFEDGAWYRATVLRQPVDGQFEVKYVDYGNIAVVPPSCLRTLKDDMLDLPAQALQCSLHGVPAAPDVPAALSADYILRFKSLSGLYEQFSAVIHSFKHGVADVSLVNSAGQRINEEMIKIWESNWSTATGVLGREVSGRQEQRSASNQSVASSSTAIPRLKTTGHSARDASGSARASVQVQSADAATVASAPHMSSNVVIARAEADVDSDDTLPDLEPLDGVDELQAALASDHRTHSAQPSVSSIAAASRSDDSQPELEEISLQQIDDSFPPPLEPLDDCDSDGGVGYFHNDCSSDTDSIAYDSAVEDPLDVLEEKIENMASLLESLELARGEVCAVAGGVDPASARDSFDRVMRVTRTRMQRLQQLASERRSAQAGVPVIPASHRPQPRRSFPVR